MTDTTKRKYIPFIGWQGDGRTRMGSLSETRSPRDDMGYWKRLEAFDARIANGNERTGKAVRRLADFTGDALQLADTELDSAMMLFERAAKKGKVKGRNNIPLVGSCLHYAMRSQGDPRPLSEVMATMFELMPDPELKKTKKKEGDDPK